MSYLNVTDPQGPFVARQYQLERIFSLARMFAAAAALLVLFAKAQPAPQSGGLARVVLAAYATFALVLGTIGLIRPASWIASTPSAHIIDLVAVVAVTSATGAAGLFSVLFLLAFLAAGFRWGRVRATAAARESAAVVSMMACADVRSGLKRTLGSAMRALQELFGASRVLLVAYDRASDKAFIWTTPTSGESSHDPIHCAQIEAGALSSFTFEPDAAAFHALRQHDARGEQLDIVAVDATGARMNAASWSVPHAFVTVVGPFDGVLAIGFDLGQEWTGRVFLLDPPIRSRRVAALAFARRVVRQVAPAIHNVYLMRRLRAEAAAAERGRFARELHDSVIQGVMGVEMEVAALSRRVTRDAPHVAAELNRLNGLLRQEVVTLREYMQQMKPLELAPDQLVDTLADFTQRFERETGIATRFVTQLDHVELAPTACREVARIVGEALINVRRHSGAQHVYVRLASSDGDCQLSIEDDGCGFPFAGRKTHAELEASRQGPFVIKDRVRLLGGQLNIESQPGQGARLEIAVPLSSHAIHA